LRARVRVEVDELDLDLAGRIVHAHGGDERAQQAPAVLRRHETPHRLEPECTQSTKWTSSTEAYGPSEARERRRRSEVAERTEHPRRLGVGHFEVGEVALGLG